LTDPGARWLNVSLHQLDAGRAALGRMLDALGYGPRPTPSERILQQPGFELHGYGGPPAAPALLIVPAPIKGPYIWDMTPQVSVVQRALSVDMRVYMLRWRSPGPREAGFGLPEAVAAIETAAAAIDSPRLLLAGHSLGGSLAAIAATTLPQRPRGLLLLASPLAFEPGVGALETLLARAPGAEDLVDGSSMPGSGLALGAYLAAPEAFGLERWLDWWQSSADPAARAMHLRILRWSLDELAMPRALFTDVVTQLYRGDCFARGRLVLGDRMAALADLTAPTLVVSEAKSRVVPAQSAYPPLLAERAQVLWYHGEPGVGLQHVGMLVGRDTHRQLWPRIMGWLEARA
jgi:polyhydroxyalkanoate synthase